MAWVLRLLSSLAGRKLGSDDVLAVVKSSPLVSQTSTGTPGFASLLPASWWRIMKCCQPFLDRADSRCPR